MHPSVPPYRQLRFEFLAREIALDRAAAALQIDARSLYRYANGERALPPVIAARLLDILGDETRFVFPQAHRHLVIRSGATPPGPHGEVPVRNVSIDTVQVQVGLGGGDELEVADLLHRMRGRALPYRGLGGKGTPLLGRRSRGLRVWLTADALRVQLVRAEPVHRAFLIHVLHEIGAGPSAIEALQICRVDVAIDYDASLSAIVVQRPRVRTTSFYESSTGSMSYGLGRRNSEVFVRAYEAHNVHPDLPVPTARVEVELKPKKATRLRDLEDLGGLVRDELSRPFAHWIAPLWDGRLSMEEVALVRLAHELGVPFVRGRLEADARATLDLGLSKLRDARPLESPDRLLPKRWSGLYQELRRGLLHSPAGHHWTTPQARQEVAAVVFATPWR